MVEEPCRWGTKMYRKPTGQISLLEDFRFFAGGKLDANNRWVKLGRLDSLGRCWRSICFPFPKAYWKCSETGPCRVVQ